MKGLQGNGHAALRIVVGLSVLLVPLLSQAQRDGARAPSTIQVLRGSGGTATREAESPVRAVRLSTDQIRSLLEPLGLAISAAAGPWRVTPAEPIAAGGRVSLELWGVQAFRPVQGYANMYGGNSTATLNIRPLNANEQYLMNCAVSHSLTFRLRGPGASGGTVNFTGTNNVVGIFAATSAAPAQFDIFGGSDNWVFESCDVTLLK